MIWVAHLGQTKWKARGVLTDYIFQNPEYRSDKNSLLYDIYSVLARQGLFIERQDCNWSEAESMIA